MVTYDEELINKLRRLGLTLYEAKAYTAILKKGIITATELSKVARIPHPRVYDVLQGLIDKGLITVSEGRPRLYKAEDPEEALRKLIERINEEFYKEYKEAIRLINKVKSEKTTSAMESIWRIEGEYSIKQKIIELLKTPDHELLISTYSHLLPDILPSLKRLSRKGISVCLVTYDYEKPIKFVDEHKIRRTHGVILVIPDRKSLLFIANWYPSAKSAPVGFYTENKHLLKLFTEYFLHNLYEPARILYDGLNQKVKRRRFVNMVRAIKYVNSLKKRGITVEAKVIGRMINGGKKVEITGKVEETIYDNYEGIAEIKLLTKEGKTFLIGGWGATLEDIEAEVIEIIPITK